jgi:hypothetical protein
MKEQDLIVARKVQWLQKLQHLPRLSAIQTDPQRSAKFATLKKEFARELVREAAKNHPDVTGNDAEKTLDFKALMQLKTELENVQEHQVFVPPPRPVLVQFVPVNFGFGNMTCGSTTTGSINFTRATWR